MAISGGTFTALRGPGGGGRRLEGVITFEGWQDSLAIRESAMVALGFNLCVVTIAIASILLTVPPGRRKK